MDENNSSASGDSEAARAIIDHQTQIIQALNEEAVRVVRLQAVALGVLVTGISVGIGAGVIEVGQFWPPKSVLDIVGLLPLVAGVISWGSEIILIPKTYSDVELGSMIGAEDEYADCIRSNDDLIQKTETTVKRLHGLFAVGLLFFIIWLAGLAY